MQELEADRLGGLGSDALGIDHRGEGLKTEMLSIKARKAEHLGDHEQGRGGASRERKRRRNDFIILSFFVRDERKSTHHARSRSGLLAFRSVQDGLNELGVVERGPESPLNLANNSVVVSVSSSVKSDSKVDSFLRDALDLGLFVVVGGFHRSLSEDVTDSFRYDRVGSVWTKDCRSFQRVEFGKGGNRWQIPHVLLRL